MARRPNLVLTGRRAYWRLPSGAYQATANAVTSPRGEGGYADLESLARLKGENLATLLDARRVMGRA